MQPSSRFRKIFRLILIGAGSLILLIGCAGLYLNQHWNKRMQRELPGYVSAFSDSLYILTFEDARLDVLSGSITIQKASMTIDSVIYQRLKAQQKAPSILYTFTVDELQLRHFRPWRYFMGKELYAGSLVLKAPFILMQENARNRDTSRPRTAYENISTKMKSIYIGRLQLDSTHFKYEFTRKDGSRSISQLHRLQITVNDFLIDARALEDPSRFLYARNYEIGLRDYMYRTKDSLYLMRFKDIRYNAGRRSLQVGQFAVEPLDDPHTFDKKTGVQQDRYDVAFNNITVDRLNPRLLLQDQQIWASKLSMNGGKVHIYRNRSLPMPPGNKLGKYPSQLLQRLSIPLYLDTLEGSRIDVRYTELSPLTGQTGTIYFRHAHGLFRNITNMDSMVKRNRHCTADVDAIFMESGKLAARFDFTLQDKAGSFAVTGQLKDLDGRQLNGITRPLGMVEIRSCKIQDLDFNIKGNEQRASGKVKLLYKDLRIALLKKDADDGKFVRKGLISFVANLMVIHDSNPLPGENVRLAQPVYTRDITRSFFNLVWKTIFTGVKETAGAGKL